jgi:hypothetical protein
VKIRKFMTLIDAIMWAATDLRRPCSERQPADYCDEGRPCHRHARVAELGGKLWRRQLRREAK